MNRNLFKNLVILLFLASIGVQCANPDESSGKNGKTENVQARKTEQPAISESVEPTKKTEVDEENSKLEEPIVKRAEISKPPIENYNIHIPSTLNLAKEVPVVFIFDPHARGGLPVELYRSLADEFGFVILASNKSRNNQIIDEGLEIYHEMKSQVAEKIHIDTSQIYILGFSGGARVAASIAIQEPQVNAVIGCGAGFPVLRRMPDPNFYYFAMVGYEDFNLGELINNDRSLTRAGFENELVIFDAGHDWPTAEVMREAFLAIQVNSIRNKTKAMDVAIIDKTVDFYENKIAQYVDEDRFFDASETSQRAASVLKDVAPVKQFVDDNKAFRKNPGYSSDLKRLLKTLEMESLVQNNFVDDFENKNLDWWKAEVSKIKTPVDDIFEQRLNKRLESYLGLISFMLSNKAIEEGNLVQAKKNLEIYRMVEPTNPEHAYLSAVVAMKNGDEAAAIDFLNQAILLGFNNLARFMQEPAFAPIENKSDLLKMMI